jgi:hypothetical protein
MAQPAADNRTKANGTRAQRAFLLAATLCIVMMPSIYRGGASVPHSHSFLQFWISGPARAFDHHRTVGHEHAGHVGHVMPDPTHAATDSAPNDDPQLSPSSAPGGTVTAIVFAIAAAFALTAPAAARWTYAPLRRLRMHGRRLSPEPPPPRFVLA